MAAPFTREPGPGRRGRRRRSGAVGRAYRAAQRGCGGAWRAAVRVLRAGVDRGLAGSGDLTDPAAGAGRGAGGRARDDRGRVLRLRAQPHAAVGQAAAGRGCGGGAGRSGPGVGRDRDRGVRAGVLRQPVRVDGPVVRALRRLAVAAGGRRAGRLACRRSRADHAGIGLVVQAGDHPDQDPGAHRDGRADPGSRAGTWAAGRRTGTGWAMRGRIRTRRMRRGDAGPTGWNPTRRPRR